MLAYARNTDTLVEDSTAGTGTVTVGTDGGTDPQKHSQHRFLIAADAGRPAVAVEGSIDGTFWIEIQGSLSSGDGHRVAEPWAHLRCTWASGGGGVNLTIYCEQISPVVGASGVV